MGEVLASGVSAVRIDLPVETAKEAADVVRRVRSAIGSATAGLAIEPWSRAPTTSGHFFRGVY